MDPILAIRAIFSKISRRETELIFIVKPHIVSVNYIFRAGLNRRLNRCRLDYEGSPEPECNQTCFSSIHFLEHGEIRIQSVFLRCKTAGKAS